MPIVLVTVLAREGYQMLRRISQPVARLLPQDRLFGILAEDLISMVAILLVFLIAGLFVGTRPGRLLSDRLEQTVLYRVPGYLLVRGAVGSFPGLSRDSRPEPAAGRDRRRLGIRPPGRAAPRRPLHGLPARLAHSHDRFCANHRDFAGAPLDAPMLSLLACLTRSGTGAGRLAVQVLGTLKASDGIEGIDDRPDDVILIKTPKTCRTTPQSAWKLRYLSHA